jgi:4-O-beta-D-mannosyl-D-glucose phosphorylase
MHVAATTVEKMLDYCLHTPEDPLRSAACVEQRKSLIARNLELIEGSGDELLKRARD